MAKMLHNVITYWGFCKIYEKDARELMESDTENATHGCSLIYPGKIASAQFTVPLSRLIKLSGNHAC